MLSCNEIAGDLTREEKKNYDAEAVGKIGGDGKPVKVDLDRQLLKPLAGTGKMFCYDSPEYVKDHQNNAGCTCYHGSCSADNDCFLRDFF